MKGFMILAYNDSQKENIDKESLELELGKRNIRFLKGKLSNDLYTNACGYQFFGKRDNIGMGIKNHFFFGDIFGLFDSDNKKSLDFSEALNLVGHSNIKNDYTAFDGNVALGCVFEDRMVFQNDLEGHRKLFYYRTSDILCVSSFLPLMLSLIKNDWRVRKNSIISFLISREGKWPFTFVENINVLPPLSRMEVTASGIRIISKTYSDFYDLNKIGKDELRMQLFERYKKTSQFKSDGKTAVTLSGGYDSNCLVKLYSEIKAGNFTAISVGYVSDRMRDKNIYDETVYAEKVAQNLGISFKKLIVDSKEFFGSFNEFIEMIDQPGHDPSSNFIMDKYLQNEGFHHLVHGMGGDANFSARKYLSQAYRLFQVGKSVGTQKLTAQIAKLANYRGPFKYFKHYRIKNYARSFHDLFERDQLFSSAVSNFVHSACKSEIDSEREYRRTYFDKLYAQSKTDRELSYSLAILCNPDVYHATLMAERNNIDLTLPFVDSKAVMMVMNGSHWNDIISREFEMETFGGIDTSLLVKGKSGFSIPYSEWMRPYSKKILDYYSDVGYFSKTDFDIMSFGKKYYDDESFSNSLWANSTMWKLLVVKTYIQQNNLSL